MGIVSPCGNQSVKSIKYAQGFESAFRKNQLENAAKKQNQQTSGLHDPEPCPAVRLRCYSTNAAHWP
jgi:hypothetical protein